MQRKIGIWLVALAYWAIVIRFLQVASPVFIDGAGPMPSFTWGRMPLPTLADYYARQYYYDLLYGLPYVIAGLIMTAVGMLLCPLVLRRFKWFLSHRFVGGWATTLVLLLLLALVSDFGSLLRLWNGPRFLMHGGFDIHSTIALSEFLLPASVLSGAIELCKHRTVAPGPTTAS